MVTVAAARKTKAEKNAEKTALKNSRKMVRVTKGTYTWPKVEEELTVRGWGIQDGAQNQFEAQTCSPKARRVNVIRTDGSHVTRILDDIISGHAMPSVPTDAEKKATNAKISDTHKGRDLGQMHVWEAAAFKAFASHSMFERYESRPVMDGRGGDVAIRLNGSIDDQWTLLQIKSATYADAPINFNVKSTDGLSGGRYEHLPILALAFEEPDRIAAREATEYDHVPEVELVYAIFYANASLMPGAGLMPVENTELGDNRLWFHRDDETKHERFEALLHEGIKAARSFSWFEANFACGPGTCNVKFPEQHYEEVLNGEVLAHLAGAEALSAPRSQNQATDLVWHMWPGDSTRISLKTASIDHYGKYGGYNFLLGKAPGAVHCDIVLAFYKNEHGVRTHVSVISSTRVYVTDKKRFYWSPTNNADVLRDRICVRSEGALDRVRQAVKHMKLQV